MHNLQNRKIIMYLIITRKQLSGQLLGVFDVVRVTVIPSFARASIL